MTSYFKLSLTLLLFSCILSLGRHASALRAVTPGSPSALRTSIAGVAAPTTPPTLPPLRGFAEPNVQRPLRAGSNPGSEEQALAEWMALLDNTSPSLRSSQSSVRSVDRSSPPPKKQQRVAPSTNSPLRTGSNPGIEEPELVEWMTLLDNTSPSLRSSQSSVRSVGRSSPPPEKQQRMAPSTTSPRGSTRTRVRQRSADEAFLPSASRRRVSLSGRRRQTVGPDHSVHLSPPPPQVTPPPSPPPSVAPSSPAVPAPSAAPSSQTGARVIPSNTAPRDPFDVALERKFPLDEAYYNAIDAVIEGMRGTLRQSNLNVKKRALGLLKQAPEQAHRLILKAFDLGISVPQIVKHVGHFIDKDQLTAIASILRPHLGLKARTSALPKPVQVFILRLQSTLDSRHPIAFYDLVKAVDLYAQKNPPHEIIRLLGIQLLEPKNVHSLLDDHYVAIKEVVDLGLSQSHVARAVQNERSFAAIRADVTRPYVRAWENFHGIRGEAKLTKKQNQEIKARLDEGAGFLDIVKWLKEGVFARTAEERIARLQPTLNTAIEIGFSLKQIQRAVNNRWDRADVTGVIRSNNSRQVTAAMRWVESNSARKKYTLDQLIEKYKARLDEVGKERDRAIAGSAEVANGGRAEANPERIVPEWQKKFEDELNHKFPVTQDFYNKLLTEAHIRQMGGQINAGTNRRQDQAAKYLQDNFTPTQIRYMLKALTLGVPAKGIFPNLSIGHANWVFVEPLLISTMKIPKVSRKGVQPFFNFVHRLTINGQKVKNLSFEKMIIAIAMYQTEKKLPKAIAEALGFTLPPATRPYSILDDSSESVLNALEQRISLASIALGFKVKHPNTQFSGPTVESWMKYHGHQKPGAFLSSHQSRLVNASLKAGTSLEDISAQLKAGTFF